MERRRLLTISEEEQEMHMQLWANYLRGDVLEEVAMHMPIADLISASLVSREWHRAVHSSLLYRPCQRPWLILRNMCNPRSSAFSVHALDPYSRSWISFTRQSVSDRPFEMVGPCFLHCSEGDRLCALMFRKMAISKDPFGARWEEDMKAPRKFRTDPVVAEVADRWVVVVGGESSIEQDYEEEGSVEVYDKQTGSWRSAGLMPAVFNGSTTAACLSAVASSRRLYVMARKTGWLTWFDPEIKQWGPVRRVVPDPSLSAWAITIASSSDEKLVVVGVARSTPSPSPSPSPPVAGGGEREGEGSTEGAVKVRVWEVDGGNLGAVDGGEREEMPGEMAGRLYLHKPGGKGRRGDSVEVCGTERGGYVCNPSEMGNGVALFEFGSSGRRRWEWEWVPVPARVGGNFGGRILCGCSTVRLSDVCL